MGSVVDVKKVATGDSVAGSVRISATGGESIACKILNLN